MQDNRHLLTKERREKLDQTLAWLEEQKTKPPTVCDRIMDTIAYAGLPTFGEAFCAHPFKNVVHPLEFIDGVGPMRKDPSLKKEFMRAQRAFHLDFLKKNFHRLDPYVVASVMENAIGIDISIEDVEAVIEETRRREDENDALEREIEEREIAMSKEREAAREREEESVVINVEENRKESGSEKEIKARQKEAHRELYEKWYGNPHDK